MRTSIPLLRDRQVWIWGVVWLLTRGFILSQVGFWDKAGEVEFQDVDVFGGWSDHLVENGTLPNEEAWQYPPGAAFLMLLPRLGWGSFGESFVVLMLAVDLIGLLLIAALSRRERTDAGVWVWLLGMPLLSILPVLRFDLVPTVFGVAALLVIHRRPAWFGALAGLGAMVKVWPVVVLLGEWDRRRLAIAVGAAVAAVTLTFLTSAIAFGDQSSFLAEQNGRGLQVESVASLPWHLRQVVTGEAPNAMLRYGAWEIASPPADFLASALKWLSLLALVGMAAWWFARGRAIAAGREDLTQASVSRDFVFLAVLLLVVTSRVLSPQFMIWLLGLAAVVLAARKTNLARPAWIVVGAVILTTGVYGSPEATVIRNLALLVAAVDASIVMTGLLRSPRVERSFSRQPEPARRSS